MVRTIAGFMAAAVMVGAFAAQAAAQDRGMPTGQPGHDQGMRVDHTLQSSKLVGLEVKNNQGESLGEIQDLVINAANGKIEYAALSHGGVLGIGDKLFAVPFSELRLNRKAGDTDEMFFALNISKEKLEAAPGFDKDKWPDFANQQWRQQIDQYYRQTDTTGRVDRETAKPVLP